MEEKTNHQFFLVTPIHFEQWAAEELKAKAPSITTVNVIKGGVEFEAPLHFGLELNYHLKIPTKILLRVGNFKARDFPKLFNSLLKLPWRQYIRQEIPEFHVSCKKSRLMNTDRIADVAKDSFIRFNTMFPAKARSKDQPSVTQSVYLRFEDDVCTASLDTSGERLHKRSYREFTGHAPIRENLAAGLLYYTYHQLLENGGQTGDSLIDPMCGTGTFLAEAKTFFLPNFSRGFNFEDFPSYRASLKPLTYERHLSWEEFLGFDIDAAIIKTNREQMKNFGLDFQVKDAAESTAPRKSAVIILNPPYGKRISIEGSPQIYFETLIKHLLKDYQPLALGILVPQDIHTPKNKGYKKQILLFKNGGIDIAYTLYLRSLD